MGLAEQCRRSFTSGDRRRGESLAAIDPVRAVYRYRDWLLLEIEGQSDDYVVDLGFDSLDAGILSAHCTCPRSQDVLWCKHIWVALQFADSFAPAIELRAGRHVDSLEYASLGEVLDDQETLDDLELVYDADAPPHGGLPDCSVGASEGSWLTALQRVRQQVEKGRASSEPPRSERTPPGIKTIEFLLSVANQRGGQPLCLELGHRTGDGAVLGRDHISHTNIPTLEPVSQQLISMLVPLCDHRESQRFSNPYLNYSFGGTSRFELPVDLYEAALPRMCRLQRLHWTQAFHAACEDFHSVAWDEGPTYRLRFRLEEDADDAARFSTVIARDNEAAVPLEKVVCAVHGGLVLMPDRLARLDAADTYFVEAFRQQALPLSLRREELSSFMQTLAELGSPAPLDIAPKLKIGQATATPLPRLVVHAPRSGSASAALQADVQMHAVVVGRTIAIPANSPWAWDEHGGQVVHRDQQAERGRLDDLQRLTVPLEQSTAAPTVEVHGLPQLQLQRQHLTQAATELTALGWEVVADGRRVLAPSDFNIRISSGTDWFDLEAEIDFGGQQVLLPALLRAIRQRQNYVTLGDGSQGLLPEHWLGRYSSLAEAADLDQKDQVRFSRVQTLLLDSLLADQDNVIFDAEFRNLRKKLQSFSGIKPIRPTRGFRGELRQYQQEGLGWFRFLRELGWGGCLADDMGLGKTVQVLALLESRRIRRTPQGQPRRPSLAVVPKSLVFNWIQEAGRFAPKLRIANYTGAGREPLLQQSDQLDLLITTYGTLRRDILQVKQLEFDYVILDEAQAIKNASSISAKACRMLKGTHRLAMTGTPVENHLGELWSLFEFLNPGMLGQAESFQRLMQLSRDVQQQGGEAASESLQWLQRGIRPFLLRRTKEQVLSDLPAKSEQVVYCEMTAKQAKAYAELRRHYRMHLNKKIQQVGLKRAKVHVLEALLRLRQAACDPRLLDPHQVCGAKLEQLEQHLSEVLSEGHKVLVFSQFTSLLRLVRERLDALGWKYSYLDGKTQRRQECVREFQENDQRKIFLISLKAGGHGLNLTRADYVFILDPWWNPAVEAQAIDRTHRIGQTRPVIAYRYICRDTVEDKIVQLQQSKRQLADAIMSAGKGMLSQLSADDLGMLLG